MKKMMFVALMVSTFAVAAQADTVKVNQGRESRSIDLNGGADGVSNEIFNILDKAGVQSRAGLRFKNLNGRDISAGLTLVGGEFYGVTFTVDAGSSSELTTNGKTLTLSGEVAEELTDDMAKSGIEPNHANLGVSYLGKNVLCSVLPIAAGGAHHICSITIR